MTDIRMIKLDADDFEAIQFALDIAAKAAGDHRGSVAVDFHELADDIREQWHRNEDEWGWPDEATDLDGSHVGKTFLVDEADFIDAGIRAREMEKVANRSVVERAFADSDTRTASLAAKRRDEQLMKGTAAPCIAEFMNDPVDW